MMARRVYLPHLAIGPLFLLAEAADHRMLPWPLGHADPAWFRLPSTAVAVGAWVWSSVAVGRPLVGIRWPAALWRPVRRWWKDGTTVRPGTEIQGEDLSWLGRGLGVAAAAVLLCLGTGAALQWLAARPFAFALVVQVADLAALALALHIHGGYAALRREAEAEARDRAERKKEERAKSELARKRQEAVEAVRAFHAGHADLLAGRYPEVRLTAELQVLIPDSATPEAAWEGARTLIRRLQAAAETERERRGDEQTLPVNPPRGAAPDAFNV